MPSCVIDFTYDRPGKGTQTYRQELRIDTAELKLLRTPQYKGTDLWIGSRCVQATHAPILWFIIPGAWYDIGAFHDLRGQFTGWYTNLCTPFDFDGTRWRSTDLFLDLWQGSDGDERWLDEDELADAMAHGLLSQDTLEATMREHHRIDRARRAGRWPPAEVRRVDRRAHMSRSVRSAG